MVVALIVILGLTLGSFLNAVIYRLHVSVSFLKGRSYCPFCKHDLNVLDLIPLVSFLALFGKCRYCKKPISWQYPLVEFGTAAAFLVLFWQFGLGSSFFVYLIYTCFLILIFVFDLRYYLILDKVSLPALGFAVILSIFVLQLSIWSVALGIVIGGGFFLIQFLVSKGKWIGGGDIRLGMVMGAMLGWQYVLIALLVSYIAGSVIGIGLIIFSKKKWKSKVPFGTFLSAGTYSIFIFGESLLEAYKDLLFL